MISSTLSLLKTQSGLSLWEEQKPSINQVLLLKESCPPLFLNWNAAPPGTSPPPGPSRRWKLPVTALYNIRSFLPIFPEGWGGSSEAQAAQPWSPRLSSVNLVPGLAQLLSHLRTPNACSQSDDPSSVHFCPFLQVHSLSRDHTIAWHCLRGCRPSIPSRHLGFTRPRSLLGRLRAYFPDLGASRAQHSAAHPPLPSAVGPRYTLLPTEFGWKVLVGFPVESRYLPFSFLPAGRC